LHSDLRWASTRYTNWSALLSVGTCRALIAGLGDLAFVLLFLMARECLIAKNANPESS
jgi:hypothetical protein